MFFYYNEILLHSSTDFEGDRKCQQIYQISAR